jgi:hypothetical protein
MPILRSRLVQYTPLGARLGAFATLTHDVTCPLNDVSTVTWKQSALRKAAEGSIVEVGFEILSGTTWIEPPGCRFVAPEKSGDPLDDAELGSYQGQNLVCRMLRGLQIEEGSAELVDGARRFNSSTPGAILKTLVDEGHARGWAAAITIDFTASLDSTGAPWATTLSIGYKPGDVNVLEVLTNLSDQGVIEWRTEGRVLRVFNPGHGVDRTVQASPVILRRVNKLPVKASLDSLVTDVTLRGEQGFRLDLNNPAATNVLGRLEAAISQGGVSDPGTATLLAQRTLDEGAQVRREITATMQLADSEYTPWLDYAVGDWVKARINGWEKVRIRELVYAFSADETVVSLKLNDRYIELLEKLAKKTTGIVGGALAGGSGVRPTPDSRRPKAPVDVVASSAGYWAGTLAQSQVSIEWTPVTQGVNSVAIDVDLYEVWAAEGDGELNALTTTTNDTVSWSPFTPESTWRFAVRARSKNGVWGALSTPVEVSMSTPVAQLLAPSAPIVTTEHGVIDVSWDGLFDGETLAPVSFMQMNVETSENATDGFAIVATLWETGEHRILRGQGGDSLYIRFTPVDVLGRPGPSSTATLVNVADFIPSGYITAAMLDAGVGGQLDITANDAVTIIVGQIAAAMAGVDANASEIADLRTYFAFEPDGLYISMPGSSARLRLANDRIEMLNGGQVIGYWEGGVFVATSITTALAQVGNHVISGEIPGHTTWRPV